MTNKYRSDLTYELRQRGLTDAAIDDILDALPAGADLDLTNEFGEPKQYAESYPKDDRRTTGWWIITVAVVVAVLAVLIRVLGVVANLFEQSIGISIAVLVGGVALVAVAAIVAAAVDRSEVSTRQ